MGMRFIVLACFQAITTANAAECVIDTSGAQFKTALTSDVGFLGMAYACEPRIGSLPKAIGRMMIEETLRAGGSSNNDAVIQGDQLERKAQLEAASLTTEQILERRWDEYDICMKYVEEGQKMHRTNLAYLRKAMCE